MPRRSSSPRMSSRRASPLSRWSNETRRVTSLEGWTVSAQAQLAGQTVLVIGGSSGIGLETARFAHAAGAEVILTARDADRLGRVGRELGASTAAFDASDFERLERFFADLRKPVAHVLVSGPAAYDAPLAEVALVPARRAVD